MSQMSDVILGDQFLNINRRDEIDGAINLAIAAKAKVATSPAVAAIELDSAMARLAKVIRSMNPEYDFGFPSKVALDGALAEVVALKARIAELEKKPAKVAPPVVVEEPKEAPPAIAVDDEEPKAVKSPKAKK